MYSVWQVFSSLDPRPIKKNGFFFRSGSCCNDASSDCRRGLQVWLWWAPDRWGILCRFPPQSGPLCLLDPGRVELKHTRSGVLHRYLPYFFCCTACFWWYIQWCSYPVLCFNRWCRKLVLLAGRGSYPGTSTGVVVPAVNLDRYCCIPRITAPLHNVL